jgi:16S rRNA (uracil1498-N3)-methyltransferase
MRVARIYQSFEQIHEGFELELDIATRHYLLNVLRLRTNNELIIFNGRGQGWLAKLLTLHKKQAKVKILEAVPAKNESPLNIHLVQGVAKSERMDFVLQKATELGVKSITPVVTKRSNIKVDKERWEKKQQHWSRVLISACEQSGRFTLPALNETVLFHDYLPTIDAKTRLVLALNGEDKLSEITANDEEIVLMIGPEGGLTPEEQTLLVEEYDFKSIKLGPRVLRTETASVAAISILQYLIGDF